MKRNVAVIGAAGHIGIPQSLVIASVGHKVWGIDTNLDACKKLNSGQVPYVEEEAEKVLSEVQSKGLIQFTNSYDVIEDCDTVVITIGTPIDEEGNPKLDYLLDFINNELLKRDIKGLLIILRSTVSPGTTELVKKIIEEKTNLKEGYDFYLVFCPERVVQTKGIVETKSTTALIGTFCNASFVQASTFLNSFCDGICLQLTPREAEFAKLITNMYRYVNFALANEFYLLGSEQGINVHKVIQAANFNYSRMDCPQPGPNVGGPCLFKDGKFLLLEQPYPELIKSAFDINEGMPGFIIKKIKEKKPYTKKILILGMTFKADCDDTRHSLSYKLKKLAKLNGHEVVCHDPYFDIIKNHSIEYAGMNDYDAVILMTPHRTYNNMSWRRKGWYRHDTLIIDIWKFWPRSQKTINGIYFNNEVDE